MLPETTPVAFRMMPIPIQQKVLLSGSKNGSWLDLQIMVDNIEPVTADVRKWVALLGPSENLRTDFQGLFQDSSHAIDGTVLLLCVEHHVAHERIESGIMRLR